MKLEFLLRLKVLRLNRKFIFYSAAYGISSLIIPLGVQFLVNNLSLSAIWLNIISFILIVGVLLVFASMVKHSQVILIESLQREIFVFEINRWKMIKTKEYGHYYFEVAGLLKSFAKAYSHLVELFLMVLFGVTTIIIFHPAFIVLAIFIGLTILSIYRTFTPSIDSSVIESNEKYAIFDTLSSGQMFTEAQVDSYLLAREGHFKFTRLNSFKVSILAVTSQIFLLGLGSYFIKNNQLSVGQLVSAEIIVSGILFSLTKLPQTLEGIFDFETGQKKIAKALKGQI